MYVRSILYVAVTYVDITFSYSTYLVTDIIGFNWIALIGCIVNDNNWVGIPKHCTIP